MAFSLPTNRVSPFAWAAPIPGRNLAGAEKLVGFLRFLLAFDKDFPQGPELEEGPGEPVRVGRDEDGPRAGQALQARGKVRGIPHGRVVHPKVITDAPYDHRAGVKPDAHLEVSTVPPSDLFSISFDSLLNGQSRMTSSLSMILMGYRRTEQSHHSVAGKLVDRTLVLVNLIHQNLEASVHDLVDFLGVELLGYGRVIGDVRKEDGD